MAKISTRKGSEFNSDQILIGNNIQGKRVLKKASASTEAESAEGGESSEEGAESAVLKELKLKDFKARGLMFQVCVVNGQKKVKCERRYKDFDYLRLALARSFPGCFVPRLVGTDIASAASAVGLS